MTEKSMKKTKDTGNTADRAFSRRSGRMDDIADKKIPKAPAEPLKKDKFAFIKKFNEKRDSNTERFKRLNLILLIVFPIFICSMAEITQAKSVSSHVSFWLNHPSIMIFNIIIASLIFVFFLSVFKKGWIAVLIQSIAYMALGTTELFKYNTNGNHLILSDMKLFKSVKSLKSFAYIKITWALILSYIVVIAFFALVFYFNPKIKFKPLKRVIASVVCVLPFFGLIMIHGFYTPVYSFFKIDTTPASNDILLNEKFQKNSFLAFLVQTASESYANRLVKPNDYNKSHIQQIMNVNVDDSGDFNGGIKPNVIFIMSESYADFRVFDQLNVDDSYYQDFDKICNDGHSGTLITPTYASWTVRSEFELMFGLPVKGIKDPNMPQRDLAEHDLPAMARYYDSWGYNTAYVHPFQITFYNRNKIYSRFGFDQMIYHDDYTGESTFTVDVNHYGTYVEDATVFDQLLDLIKTSDEPMYIHTTTMQNHQPYNQGEDPDNEFGNYLRWIQHTNEDLVKFIDQLKEIDEPTLVFFVGDHFPSLRGESSVYNQLGLTGDNCSELFEQTYFLWSNYDADFSSVPDEKLSFFYIPYVIIDLIDAPHDAFIEKMISFMKTTPVYSTAYNDDIPNNEELDLITYDRVVGDVYSPSPITD